MLEKDEENVFRRVFSCFFCRKVEKWFWGFFGIELNGGD